jgi:CRP/FNR family transcriptional regulator, cyclic AMP receptor protein
MERDYRGSVAVVRVLATDPDLAGALSGDRLRNAERVCLAKVLHLPRGPWGEAESARGISRGFGLLVLQGVLSRRVGRGGRFGAELLGPGDLLRPWEHRGDQAAMPFAAQWQVFRSARLAILDRHFAVKASPYPEIADQLIGRAVLRSRRLAVTVAIVHHPTVKARVHMLLWFLAERWGTVRADGVALSLPLTHGLLADMVAASRPAVSAALSALTNSGRLRRDRDVWLLRGRPPAELEDLAETR